MTLDFVKMHGCGNDYIYFDCFDQKIEDLANLSRKLSKEHFGIGADGIIFDQFFKKCGRRNENIQ